MSDLNIGMRIHTKDGAPAAGGEGNVVLLVHKGGDWGVCRGEELGE